MVSCDLQEASFTESLFKGSELQFGDGPELVAAKTAGIHSPYRPAPWEAGTEGPRASGQLPCAEFSGVWIPMTADAGCKVDSFPIVSIL